LSRGVFLLYEGCVRTLIGILVSIESLGLGYIEFDNIYTLHLYTVYYAVYPVYYMWYTTGWIGLGIYVEIYTVGWIGIYDEIEWCQSHLVGLGSVMSLGGWDG
jgi:hypothetical protein